MSNPTSNFGWQMPTATDLVTDLPADFEVFGQAVDTDFADLNGGTTGQILSKTSATDLDFTWINNDQGDITGVTAGTGISGGGTSGAVTVTNSMATAITTNGDLIYGTGSGTFSRLGIGSSGQILNVTSGVPAWTTPTSGSMTVIASGSFSNNASVVLSSIVGTYKDLSLRVYNFRPASDGEQLYVRLNGDTGNNYVVSVRTDGDSTSITFANRYQFYGDTDNGASTIGAGELKIINYSSSTVIKGIQSNASGTNQTSPPNQRIQIAAGLYNSTTAITSITMLTGGGDITSGSYELLGIN
jgi:hypothetical protein